MQYARIPKDAVDDREPIVCRNPKDGAGSG
jgi:hypothetical protein